MPKTLKSSVRVSKRIYLHGNFRGKFEGKLDEVRSDFVCANFYSLDFLSGEIETTHSNIRHWNLGEAPQFADLSPFPRRSFVPVICNVHSDAGSVEHFIIALHEPKLLDPEVVNQVYEGRRLFTTIVAGISGYLLHEEVEEVITELPDPPLSTAKTSVLSEDDSAPQRDDEQSTSASSTAENGGCSNVSSNGCLEGCATIFLLLVGLVILWAICTSLWGWVRSSAPVANGTHVETPRGGSNPTSSDKGRTGRFTTNQHLRAAPDPNSPSVGIHFQDALFRVYDQEYYDSGNGKTVWYRVVILRYGCHAENRGLCGKNDPADLDVGWLSATYVKLD